MVTIQACGCFRPHARTLPRGEAELFSAVRQHRANRRLARLERGIGKSSTRVIKTRRHDLPLSGGSACLTSYLLDTVSLDQSLRKSMTTNQLSLLRTAIGRVTQFREHLTRRPARASVMPCAFASLRLCVLTASVPTQRRRGAKTQRGPGQEAVDWIGRPRAIAENRSARLLTDEPWTASRWRERGSAVEVSVNGKVPGGSSPSLGHYP